MKIRVTRLLIILILSGLLLGAFYLMLHRRHSVVTFTDQGLEAAVRDALNNQEDPLRRFEVEQLTRLDARNRGITHLEGIEALRYVRVLDFEDNFITDVSPLATLRHLEELSLRNNEITSLEAIGFAALHDVPLRHLNLRHNVLRPNPDNLSFQFRLEDLTLLESLTSLETLELRDNHIVDISPLQGLTNLRRLDLSKNPLDHLIAAETLRMLSRLEYLNLRETALRTLAFLDDLQALTYLNLHSNTEINDVSPLRNLVNLETLIMQHVPVGEQIDQLEPLTRLQRLNLRNTGITSVDVLAQLMAAGALQDDPASNKLAEIDIRDNPIPLTTQDDQSGYALLDAYWSAITYRRPHHLPQPLTQTLFINEIMSSNGQVFPDEDGDFEDWIELFNPHDQAMDLSGFFLSDDPDDPLKWQFPNGITLAAHSHLVVYASGKDRRNPDAWLHTNFSISQSGQSIVLTHADRVTRIDQTLPVFIPRNMSYGRWPDGSSTWAYFEGVHLTPGATNNAAQTFDPPDWM
ncbi:MAG: hypothetical protein EA374_03235 [Acholeplasmatales bacterium]|nr:MAG: hypothetical protein EA374_03235 [Acholeplasmatales bacterium]